MNSKRINRISEEVKRTISDIVQNELKDPRIPSITSISHVEVTNDLSYAKVYVSVLGNDFDRDEAIEGLNSAKGFIKKELSKKIKLRAMPELIFIKDDSIEKSLELDKLIDEVNHGDE
ncbi:MULTISPECIES: 30S ribosome-binding factor RbfA [Peptoniphilus]|jgi:ribosome-binding factor A|uniref:30S ribosome-binding factor RbfA n=2 Tax=Peptoniphilaceae TaxID=1570339 RepID=UPI0008D9DB37|nr:MULTISPECIES: 30S ribosome-binding factor RbfA [Peptoniphilus]MBS6609989.1 30S ribosome-binding factor RbfA [Peptoniphilus harei]MDU1043520.1 30S ribosome-binding factor RbfA [Peptoniphilus rhinitidis]MDU1954235.1 30S ribosome-binding factor RbfA [Peptoniphilus lacydonensis]MDU2110793.1 30S ribosome-binding factor RbfA [Peptoniphilus lacydonensis]MDU5274589.1 30S ribosome-binding factor RbfA [Peptoniphilus lacydonensis]